MSKGFCLQEVPEEEIKCYIDPVEQTTEYKDFESMRRMKLLGNLRKELENIRNAVCLEMDRKEHREMIPEVAISILKGSKKIWNHAIKYAETEGVFERNDNPEIIGAKRLFDSKEVVIEKTEEGYRIMVPTHLPYKRAFQYTPAYCESFKHTLYNAFLRRFPREHDVFTDKVDVIITHHFSDKENLIDYDNYDYSGLLNCIADFFLTDDRPIFYNLHIEGRRGRQACIEVVIKSV